MVKFDKILVIQTAFIGDVILSTSLIETIHHNHPNLLIDVVVRKGNEGLLLNHPHVNHVIVWDKKGGKYKNLIKSILEIRKQRYSKVICLQRFFNAGVMTLLSKSKDKRSFDKNPLSRFFNKTIKHEINNGKHEVERNYELIKDFCPEFIKQPKLYISEEIQKNIVQYKTEPFICIAPSSVWFTKQAPKSLWIELLQKTEIKCYVLGGPGDKSYCDEIISLSQSTNAHNLCGKLNLLESAALMKHAEMNFVNDSAPLHLCSATNAPVTAIFCSTIPEFGFGPLGEKSSVVQIEETLSCRPCGIHGKKECPEKHFKCGNNIQIDQLLSKL